MARKPVPGSDEGKWGEILNTFLDVAHTEDGTLKDNSVVESKLAPGVRSKLNAPGGGAPPDGSIDTAKLADGAVTNVKVAANAGIAQSKIANLTTDLGGKANATHTHTVANVAGLQAALDGKAAADHSHPTPSLELDDLSDVSASDATTGQVLTWQGSQWAAADQTGGGGSGGVTDHGALTGLGDDDHPQYLNNTRGDTRYYTRSQVDSALQGKADTTHTHSATAINSGVLSPARLGSGTASAGTVLHGDGTWKDAPSGGGGGSTNLSASTTANDVTVASSTGTNATLAGATPSAAGVLTASDKTKLNGIALAATANASDAQLRDRATHTGTQPISSVANLQTNLDSKANSNATVNLTGDQTVGGTKTFSVSPVIPSPTTNTQAANKAYVDSVAGGGGGMGIIAALIGSEYGDANRYSATNNQFIIANPAANRIAIQLPAPTNGAFVKVKKDSNATNGVIIWPPDGQDIHMGMDTSLSDTCNVYGQVNDYWGDGTRWHRG